MPAREKSGMTSALPTMRTMRTAVGVFYILLIAGILAVGLFADAVLNHSW